MTELIASVRIDSSAVAASPKTVRPEREPGAIWTDELYVVWTSVAESLAALRVASDLARTIAVPLTVVEFRSDPLYNPAPGSSSLGATEASVDHLRASGVDARARIVVCRGVRQAIASMFRPHALIFLGGRPNWWPTRAERLRRAFETAGHFVVLVHEREHREPQHA